MISLLLAASVAAATSIPLYAPAGGLPLPLPLQRRASGSGGVPVDSTTSEYTPLAQLAVGTPPQTLSAVLDVGSGLTVVGGSPFAGGAFYGPGSRTLQVGEKMEHAAPALGPNASTRGVRATDTLALGGLSATAEFRE